VTRAAQHLGVRIRAVLTPDLLKPAFRRQAAGRVGTFGHCYAASEAAYHLLGGKRAGWTPQSIRHEGFPHWFLRHRSGEVLDLTGDQFATPVPYEDAVGKGFLTREPSARARQIMTRVAGRRMGSGRDSSRWEPDLRLGDTSTDVASHLAEADAEARAYDARRRRASR